MNIKNFEKLYIFVIIFKSAISWIWAVVALTALTFLLLLGIEMYKRKRMVKKSLSAQSKLKTPAKKPKKVPTKKKKTAKKVVSRKKK